MIRITKQSDYGIVMLTYMASADPGHVHTARHLAGRSGLSLPMVSKILKPLARSGIINSHRGVKGGYTLARPAREITVGEIIAALEGPIGMTTCVAKPGSCEQEDLCPVKVNWEKISYAVRDALDEIPLSDMVGPPLVDPLRSTDRDDADRLISIR
jgi:FeS assembly SUF system regulator